MEQTKPSRLPTPTQAATAKAFGTWLHDQLVTRGYSMSPRGGGVTRFAEDCGVSKSVISTILRGQNVAPSPESLRLIAAALGVPFPEVLVRSGVLSANELRAVQDPGTKVGRPPITPEEAARELGLTDPALVTLFSAYVDALRNQRPASDERAD